MDIYGFKRLFDQATHPPAELEAGWQALKPFLKTGIDAEASAELGFSLGIAEGFDGIRAYRHEHLLEVYLGWLIDAQKGSPWQTAEINIYFRYLIDPELQRLLEELPDCALETFYCLDEGAETVRRKCAGFSAFVDGQQAMWATLPGRVPVNTHIQFFIQ